MIDIRRYINATILPEWTIFFEFENNEIYQVTTTEKQLILMKEGRNIV